MHELDYQYMEQAIKLAKKGMGKVYPNPMVGAIVVKDGEIVGTGYHMKYGTHHAEVHALEEAGKRAKGATLYVSLEPCSHHGKTPPCADLVIEKGIKKVVVAMKDPNPLVNGKGLDKLRDAGIEVVENIMQEQAEELNAGFITRIKKQRSLFTSKIAMSLDGKIATKTGESKWITNETMRMYSHNLRAEHDAILVGINTVLADNPQLNCRKEECTQPDCIIMDTNGRTPTDAKIFNQKDRNVRILVGENCSIEKINNLELVGAIVEVLPIDGEHISIVEATKYLFACGYSSVLIEGGSTINATFIEHRLVDRIWTFIGDCIIGGKEAKPAIDGTGICELKNALGLIYKKVEIIENNICIVAESRESVCLQELLRK